MMFTSSGCDCPAGKANKFTLRHYLDVMIPHQVQGVLVTKGHEWLTEEKLLMYQDLLDTPDVTNPLGV